MSLKKDVRKRPERARTRFLLQVKAFSRRVERAHRHELLMLRHEEWRRLDEEVKAVRLSEAERLAGEEMGRTRALRALSGSAG